MTTIETIAATIGAVLIFPYLCRLIRRPAILYCSYLLLGVALSNFLNFDTRSMIDEVGKVGFILLLFIVGLEIDLPPFGTLRKSFWFCFTWLAIQIPLFVLFSFWFGLGTVSGLVAGAGINACSLGISYGLLESQKGIINDISIKKMLIGMVVLEIVSLFILAISEVVYAQGWSKEVVLHSAVLIGFILMIRSFSGVVHKELSRVIENAGRWKIHQVLLTLLGITIIGDRFGLSAAKTAFFLGLFMSSTTHKGIKFEDELRSIAHNVLIPIFFVSLGSKISIANLFSYIFPAALGITLVLFAIRYFVFRWAGNISIPTKYFLIFCPNLTMVAVAAGILGEHNVDRRVIDLLLATGLIMTVGSAFFFPAKKTVGALEAV